MSKSVWVVRYYCGFWYETHLDVFDTKKKAINNYVETLLSILNTESDDGEHEFSWIPAMVEKKGVLRGYQRIRQEYEFGDLYKFLKDLGYGYELELKKKKIQ